MHIKLINDVIQDNEDNFIVDLTMAHLDAQERSAIRGLVTVANLTETLLDTASECVTKTKCRCDDSGKCKWHGDYDKMIAALDRIKPHPHA